MGTVPVDDRTIAIATVLSRYPQVGSSWRTAPLGTGLINETFAVEAGRERFVLQRVHPVFAPEIHFNIAAVTEHLRQAAIPTPLLCRTDDDALWVEHDGRVWRLMTRLCGVSFDAVGSPAQAESAAETLGRFHGALVDLDHEFVGMRSGVHDTPRHLQHLRDCLAKHRGHRLFPAVEPIADELLAAADELVTVDAVPDRVVHGDPKFNNILFEVQDGPGASTAVGLIDLDTVGPMALHLELGDAWRSWCNPRGEDETTAQFDLAIFEASVRGWSRACGLGLEASERVALVHGVEWITLELAARFLADALAESYFGFDPARFETRGHHNLVRSQGQLRLHAAVVANRQQRADVLCTALATTG